MSEKHTRVKDLIKFLKECDQEAVVLSQDYTGCHHVLLNIETQFYPKGATVHCEESWVSSVVDGKKKAKTPVVTIIGVC